MRSRTCGATSQPLQGQKALNSTLPELTNSKRVRNVIFTAPSKRQKDSIEKDIWGLLKESSIEDFLGPERKRMAGSWATQSEVKQVLKEGSEMGEQAAVSFLAERSAENKSQSSIMRKNWNFLANVAGDRTVQTTFGNLMGAIRFEASKHGNCGTQYAQSARRWWARKVTAWSVTSWR